MLRIGQGPTTNVSTSGVTNIINNNNINNFYINKETQGFSSTLLTAGTEQPMEALEERSNKHFYPSSSADKKPKRPSTAGPPPEEKSKLLQDDFVSGLKASYKGSLANTGVSRTSLDRGKVGQSSTDSLRSKDSQGWSAAPGKKREGSLRKSADSKPSSSANFGSAVFSKKPPITQDKRNVSGGLASDRTSNSARSQTTSSTQVSQSTSVALNIGSNTYRGGSGQTGAPQPATASTMSGYNPSSSRSTTQSQVGMNSFRSGPVKATTEAIDFSKYSGGVTSSSTFAAPR